MRSRGTGQKRLMQPKKLSRACSSLQRTCGGQIRQNSRERALPNCRWLRAPGVPPSKALPPKSRHSSSQPTCGLELEALETPRPSQPRTVNPIIAACTRSQLSPSPNPLHRAANSIVPETPLFPSPIAAAAPRSILQDDRLLVSCDRDWRRRLPPSTRRAFPCSLHSFRGSASPHCMRFDSGMHADNAVSVAPSTRLVPPSLG